MSSLKILRLLLQTVPDILALMPNYPDTMALTYWLWITKKQSLLFPQLQFICDVHQKEWFLP